MAITKVNFTSNTAWETQKQLNDNFADIDKNKADTSDVPTKTSDLENDSNFITKDEAENLGGKIDAISVNGNPQPVVNKTVNITIPVTASDVGALSDTTKYGADINLTMDSETYVITIQLKDQNGNNLGTAKTIDLPLESVVISGSYNSETKKVVLTLKDGSTIEFSIADLVSGLQTEISQLQFTLDDSRWGELNSDGFYTITISSNRKPFAVYNTNGEQIMAGLKYDGSNIYVVTDTKFTGSVSVY